jgi:hypothetical protein
MVHYDQHYSSRIPITDNVAYIQPDSVMTNLQVQRRPLRI